jgi:hypothetical protein
MHKPTKRPSSRVSGYELLQYSFLDSLHCIYSWRQRPGREFTVSSAVINENLDLVGPDMYAELRTWKKNPFYKWGLTN